MNTIAAKAIAFAEILETDFAEYSQNTISNAAILAEKLKFAGGKLVTDGNS